MGVYKNLCHQCGGSEVDEDAERAADTRNCPNCHGSGEEPAYDDDPGDNESECPLCFGTRQGEGLDFYCYACR